MNLAEEYLSQRGVSLEFARKQGVEFDSLLDADQIRERLGGGCFPLWDMAKEIIWFPVTNTEAGVTISWIARPLPTLEKIKFHSKTDGGGPPFIPRLVWTARKKTDQPIIITEGPVKGLAIHQAGALPISLNGVWMSVSKNGDEKYGLRQELLEFQWLGRRVYLCFDADQISNPDVLQALLRTAFALNAHGAQVFQLTTWPASQGKGIDDYLVGKSGSDLAKQKDCLEDLIRNAQPFLATLRPFTISKVETELRKVAMSPAQRSQLCKALSGPLEVKASALEEEQFLPGELAPNKRGRFEENIEPWPDAVIGDDLLQEIVGELGRFVDRLTKLAEQSKRSADAGEGALRRDWLEFLDIPDQRDKLEAIFVSIAHENALLDASALKQSYKTLYRHALAHPNQDMRDQELRFLPLIITAEWRKEVLLELEKETNAKLDQLKKRNLELARKLARPPHKL